jgi:hypothetical protein
MFSNLTKGSIIYGLETKGSIKPFTALVTNVSLPRSNYNSNTFGQLPEVVIDITATVDGVNRVFKQVPGNSSIANFGSDVLLIADSKETINAYISSMLQNSKNIVKSVSKHEALIAEYSDAYNYFNPEFNKIDDKTVSELRGEIKDVKSQIGEIFAFIKGGNIAKAE